METVGIPNIQMYVNAQSELCICRVRRAGEAPALVVAVPIDELMAGGATEAGQRLGGALLKHLASLYPDVITHP